jgi:hypothetical protein
MTSKEKALELVDTYCRAKLDNGIIGIYQPLAKQCALICVDEMLAFDLRFFDIEFLKEVKQEIEKL